jgi:hypothetical protein
MEKKKAKAAAAVVKKQAKKATVAAKRQAKKKKRAAKKATEAAKKQAMKRKRAAKAAAKKTKKTTLTKYRNTMQQIWIVITVWLKIKQDDEWSPLVTWFPGRKKSYSQRFVFFGGVEGHLGSILYIAA